MNAGSSLLFVLFGDVRFFVITVELLLLQSCVVSFRPYRGSIQSSFPSFHQVQISVRCNYLVVVRSFLRSVVVELARKQCCLSSSRQIAPARRSFTLVPAFLNIVE